MMDLMWAVDVEGSGKSPPELVEIALAEMRGLRLTGVRKHWRLRPRHGISPVAARIHGIWDRDVEDAPELEDVADDLLTWLEERPIVGHNVKVELTTLSEALEDWKPRAAYDTLKMARRLLPNEERHGLEHLGSRLGLDVEAAALTNGVAHSAPYDAVACALLMRHLLDPLRPEVQASVLEDADITRSAQGQLI